MTPFQLGFDAYGSGKPPSSNPYPDNTPNHEAWKLGWEEAWWQSKTKAK